MLCCSTGPSHAAADVTLRPAPAVAPVDHGDFPLCATACLRYVAVYVTRVPVSAYARTLRILTLCALIISVFFKFWIPVRVPCAVLTMLSGGAGALTKAGISFTPAVASVFCWVDLRSALPQATWEAERQLWEEGFVQRCGFIITPGMGSAGLVVPADQS